MKWLKNLFIISCILFAFSDSSFSQVVKSNINHQMVNFTFFENTIIATSTAWIDVTGIFPINFHIDIDTTGSNTATVQIRGSNNPVQPLIGATELQIGTNITNSSFISVNDPYHWVQLKISSMVNSNVSVYLQGQDISFVNRFK